MPPTPSTDRVRKEVGWRFLSGARATGRSARPTKCLFRALNSLAVLLLAWAAVEATAAEPYSAQATPPPIAPSPGDAKPAARSASPAPRSDAIPFAPRARGGREGSKPRQERGGALSSLLTVGSSLALVLGLFFIVAWAMRRTAPRGSLPLPGEVFEILGRAPLAARNQVHLLRLGNKLLLVCATPAGVETLTEITDSDEVSRLAGLCRQAHPSSTTAAFQQVFHQFSLRGKSRPVLPENPDDLELANAGVPHAAGLAPEDHDV